MIEYLPFVLTGIGLSASILYYASNLRNANKTQRMQLETRQVQLFMNIDATRGSPEFQKLFYRVVFMDEWKDIDDYYVKYGPENNLDGYSEHLFIWQRFDSLGFLLKKNVIDLTYFDDVLKASALAAWSKFETVIIAIRERSNQLSLWNQFEYLANEIRRTQQ
jgi:hypothetical protein